MEKHELENLHNPPEVIEVGLKKFRELKRQFPNAHDIEMNTFQIVHPVQPTINQGAGPCVIIWEFDRKTGEMLRTGHFPEVSEKRADHFTVEEIDLFTQKYRQNPSESISVPNETEVARFGYPDRRKKDDSYEQFNIMSKQISQEIKQGRSEKVIFLFGQNFVVFQGEEDKDQSIVENAIEHNQLTTDIRNWGVPENSIQDHRSADHDGVDYTLYVPEEHKIYHFHKKETDPYP